MLQWSVTENAEPAELAVISDGVMAFGRNLAAGGMARQIACFVRDGHEIVAGASGRTEFSRLFVNYLWVDAGLRSQGIGSEILLKLEHAAIERACTDSLIETLSDRTALLYERLGYRRLATIAAYVGPFTKHVLLKSFITDRAEGVA